jgi:hypothetical protein
MIGASNETECESALRQFSSNDKKSRLKWRNIPEAFIELLHEASAWISEFRSDYQQTGSYAEGEQTS